MKSADLRVLVDWMTRGPWYPRGRFVSLVPNSTGQGVTMHTNHVATFVERADTDAVAALRNHATALCDLADAVRAMLEAAEVSTDMLYLSMAAVRQALAKLEEVQ